ncbi:MAG: biopolymer transporter ExbD, partial [Treponema sp.]|nr:biopolymer transporter ExbD [Treponema sp.]
MKLQRKKKTGFLETAAASDLAFLLIIYFIVIAGFNINQGFLIHLPAKDSTRMILKEDLLRFDMDSAGNIIYNAHIIDIPEARSLVSSARAENPGIAVILTIDPQARWQQVVSFVEIAQHQKIEAFSFT